MLTGVEILHNDEAESSLNDQTHDGEEVEAYERSIPEDELASRESLLISNQVPRVLAGCDELVSLAPPLIYESDVHDSDE